MTSISSPLLLSFGIGKLGGQSEIIEGEIREVCERCSGYSVCKNLSAQKNSDEIVACPKVEVISKR